MTKEDILICTDELCSDFSRLWTTLKKALPWILAAYLLMVILMSLLVFQCEMEVIYVIRQFKSLDTAVVYWELIQFLILGNWLALVVIVPMLVVWSFFCYCVWIIASFAINLCHQLFFPDSSRWRFENARYHKVVDASVRLRMKFVHYIVLVPMAVFLLISLPTVMDSPEKIIRLYFKVIVALVPIVFVVVWTFYLIIRRSRKNTRRFDYYFFAKQAIKDRLRTIVSLVLFLAIFGNIFLPWLFIGFGSAINIGPKLMPEGSEYEQKHRELVRDGYTSDRNRGMANLPSPHEVRNYVWYFLGMGDNLKPKALIKQFQKAMFSVVTLACFFLVAIPACGNAIVYRERIGALKKIILSTAISMVIVAGLHFCITKAYFVDTSEFFGMATLFLLIVSLSLSHGSIDPLKSKYE